MNNINQESIKIIEVKNLLKNFNSSTVLENINFYVNKGEVVSLIGPSGSGKSTLLRCIIDLEEFDEGEIYIENKNLKDKKFKNDLLLKMGMVFQNFNLFPHMTVKENIVKTLKLVKKMLEIEADKKVKEVLELVGLYDKRESFPNELSGGQKQRVAIARALALEPDILLFDEPTSALDPELVKEVLDIIKKLKQKKNITMLIVSHEMKFVKEISDKIIVLENSKILEIGSAQKIFENPSSARVKEFVNNI